MTQNVQDLIDKIKKEGLEESQKKAREIEHEVQKKVDDMIAKAKVEAEKIIADARAEQKKIEESTRASLQQAARDTVLTLKQAVLGRLQQIIQKDVRDALGPDQMSALIVELSKEFISQHRETASVDIELNKEACERLQKDLLAKLQSSVKGGLNIRSSEDLTGGFMISFDEGKSSFDFSEEALVAFLSRHVNDYVKEILKDKG